jgi:putative aldouronate transport system substrate-binding protein
MTTFTSVTRRKFMLGSASGLALGAAGAVLSACSDAPAADSGGTSTTTPPDDATTASAPPLGSPSAPTSTAPPSPVPAYVEYTGMRADLPGTVDGVMPAFLNYPSNPTRAVTTPPGRGGTVTSLVPALGPQLLNPQANGHWQAVDKALGVTMKVSGGGFDAITQMSQTRIASGDLPDIMWVSGLPDLPSLLKAKFADLSEFLAGDAAKEYPLLTNIPTAAWETVLVDGRIYGMPLATAPVPPNIICRTDMFTEAGVEPKFADAKEFLDTCKVLTNLKRHTWAFGEDPATSILPFIAMMLEVSNNWKLEGGKLTSALEEPNYKKAIDFTAMMWKAGVVEPDAIANPVEYPTWYAGKRIAMTTGSLSSWQVRLTQILAAGLPGTVCYGILMPKFDGGGPAAYWKGPASYGTCALKKATPERIKELLGVMNWLAAPFGTTEYVLRHWGVKDRNYTLDGSDPVPVKDQQKQELLYFYDYMVNPPSVLYNPGSPDVVKQQHDLQTKLMPTALADPTSGLVSATNLEKGPALSKLVTDAAEDIITGRKPLSSWDDAVKKWKSTGGDAMAKEYEEALATK